MSVDFHNVDVLIRKDGCVKVFSLVVVNSAKCLPVRQSNARFLFRLTDCYRVVGLLKA